VHPVLGASADFAAALTLAFQAAPAERSHSGLYRPIPNRSAPLGADIGWVQEGSRKTVSDGARLRTGAGSG